jgi:hypothetical protein
MADRYPLIYNPDASQIQELQEGDALDIGNASIVNVNGLTVTGVITATTLNQNVTGIVSASGGFNIGIQSGGTNITTGVITAINFVGTGNSISYNSSTKTVDVSISGSGGGSSGGAGVSTVGVTTTLIWSNPNIISTAQTLTYPNHNYGMFGPVSVTATINVGAGNTFVIV